MTGSKSMPAKRLRLRVDPIRCAAFGFCAELCPELFQLDDWGYAWLKRSDVDASVAELVYRVARTCPTGAILIEELPSAEEPVEVHG